MALRTFRSNPSLGGFGSGEADGDAFCQVLKELVDNAVDACRSTLPSEEDAPSRTTGTRRPGPVASARGRGTRQQLPSDSSQTPKKRVRVVIEPYDVRKHHVVGQSESDVSQGEPHEARNGELLRVTVTDNGVGMKDIQACVDPFSSSKAGHREDSQDPTSDSRSSSAVEQATAGRYGIGLTLCLLHTQRLVPDSCAIIRSATAEQPEWKQVTCVVSTDRVNGVQSSTVPKCQPGESGTTISILVPVRRTALHDVIDIQ
jgi:Histidine kinase-, DNA gyrase B-, and HSP90-like ATPase